MKITDRDVLKWIRQLDDCDLTENIETYPDDERENRTDKEFFADELSYILSCYNEDGHVFNEELEQAREVLKETKNGKEIPLNPYTLKPLPWHEPRRIEEYKAYIRHYNKLKRKYNTLNKNGLYGSWY